MKYYNRNELRDSRIFFDQKPPAFLTVFICLLALVLFLTVYFSRVINKPYIVKAQGVVTTSDNQLITPQLDGEVVTISLNEGQKVKAGDTLFTISNGQEGLQSSALTKQINDLKTKLDQMDRFVESLNTKKNKMKNTGSEQEYYGKVQYYLLQVNGDQFDKNNTAAQLDEKKQKKSELENEMNSLTNEIASMDVVIAENKKQRDALQTNIDNLQLSLSKVTEELAHSEVLSLTEVNDKIKTKQQIETQINQLTKQLNSIESTDQSNSKKSELQGKIDADKSEIESLTSDISQLETQSNQPVSQAKQIYSQLLSDVGTERSQVESKLVELNSQLSYQNGQETPLTVKAKNDGIVHYLVPLKTGMSVQRNQAVAEISKDLSNDLIVEAYIQAQDITKVKTRDSVKVALAGVNSEKYGTLKGKLISIDSGTLTQQTQNGNVVLYKCLVQLENKKLTASDGTVVRAIKSMPVEARIIYEKETYYDWVLKMLNFTV